MLVLSKDIRCSLLGAIKRWPEANWTPPGVLFFGRGRRYDAAMTRRASRAPSAGAASDANDEEPAARVLRQFRQIFNAVKTHFQQVEKKVGLGGAQVWALAVIRDRPDIGVGDLARAMNIHQSTASNLVRTLVERELVTAASTVATGAPSSCVFLRPEEGS